MQQRADKIKLFFLPSYSPDLNVAEGLNNHVKGHVGRSTKAPDKQTLTQRIRSFLYAIQRNTDTVVSFFFQRQVSYAVPVKFC